MRRRLPSPAFVIASAALFVALSGAGVAAGLSLVWSPRSNVMLAANVSSDGKVTGARVHGERATTGVYTLTIIGDTFGSGASGRHLRDKIEAVLFTPLLDRKSRNGTVTHCSGNDKDRTAAPDGSIVLEVDCFAYDPASGWQPADSAFDVQMVGAR